MTDTAYFSLKEILGQRQWPLAGIAPEITDHIWVSNTWYDETNQSGHIGVLLEQDISIRMPGIDCVAISIGSAAGATEFDLTASFNPFSIGVRIPVVLRIDADILRPIKAGTLLEPDLDAKTLDIPLANVDLSLNAAGEARLTMNSAVQIPRCMIGTSGVIIEGGSISWLGPGDPAPSGTVDPPPEGFSGLYIGNASVQLSGLSTGSPNLRLQYCYLGSGGFTGSIFIEDTALRWDDTQKDYTGLVTGELFGFKVGLRRVDIRFERNALKWGAIHTEMFLPYLDKRIGLELALSLNGDLAVALTGPQSTNPETGVSLVGSLLTIEKPDVMRLTLKSVQFEEKEGDWALIASGALRPLMPGVQWPEVAVKSFAIRSDGRVEIEGGWLDLPQQKGVNFFGFPLEVRKFGMGSDTDRRWMGFSGGLKLVDGLPVGGSVEGLKLRWNPANPTEHDIELKGVDIALDIPNVLLLKGHVSFFQEENKQWFQGSAKVDLRSLNCSLDAQVLVGRTETYTYFYVFLEAGLPTGIPLFQTGLAIYGLGGLFGYNVRPDRREGEPWYEGWYKRSPEGPTDAGKWTDQVERRVFGASVTIGTYPDNGTALNGRVLLIVIIPGPLVLIEGRMNLIQDRKSIRTSEPLFKSLAVLDGEAGTFQLNMEAHWFYPQDPTNRGAVIDLTGMAEAFFDFNHSERWYLNVGVKEPREKRIRARLLRLFEANAYFMLNQQRLALGGFVGIDERFVYGPVTLRYGAWFENDAELVFRPLQLTADAGLHGRAELKAFGVGLSVELDAVAHLTTPKPFEFSAELHAKADLPVPLPDIEVRIPFEYKDPQPPVLMVPLQSVELISLKGSEFWDTGDETNPKLVPLDGKPAIVFAKSMQDLAKVGGNIQPAVSERAGELTFDYRLDSIRLERLVGTSWIVEAETGATASIGNVRLLRGMWVPISGQGDAPPASKLVLGIRSPFEGTQGTAGNSSAEEFSNRYSGYPGVYETRDYDHLDAGDVIFGDANQHYMLDGLEYDTGALRVSATESGVEVVRKSDPRFNLRTSPWRHRQALWLPGGYYQTPPQGDDPIPTPSGRRSLRIIFPYALRGGGATLQQVRLQITTLLGGGAISYGAGGVRLDEQLFQGGLTSLPPEPRHYEIALTGPGIEYVDLDAEITALFAVRFLRLGGSSSAGQSNAHNMQSTADQWSGEEPLFQPDSLYRLRIISSVDVTPDSATTLLPQELDAGALTPAALPTPTPIGGKQRYTFAQEVYFRTEGPPGFVSHEIDRNVAREVPTLPDDGGTPKAPTSLARRLDAYVQTTLPANGSVLFYRGYDLYVYFNEPYVRQLYQGYGGRTLNLSLADRNGSPPRELTGGMANQPQWTDTSLTPEWIKQRDVGLSREQSQWMHLAGESGWFGLRATDLPYRDVLRITPTGPALAPATTYTASLCAVPGTNAIDEELFRFSFTTSRFASFVHHIHSFSGRLWDSDQSRDTPLPALSAEQQTALEAAAKRGTPDDFDAIVELFGLRFGQLPNSLEITVLRDAAKRWGFLLESPEPIDSARTSISSFWRPIPVESANQQGAIRLRDVRFGDHSSGNYKTEWIDLIVAETADLDGCAIQHARSSLGSANYSTVYEFSGQQLAFSGTIIRVHAGRAPISPQPDDGIVHVYAGVSGAGGTGWLLEAGGDALRIVDRNGSVISAQGYLPLWDPEEALWIWNADRTRALIFPRPRVQPLGCLVSFVMMLPQWLLDLLAKIVSAFQPPLGISSGTYRFEWTYSLDKPGLPLLSRARQSALEIAVTQLTVG
jgi:hypothetical protein